ncbi:MAG TPA: hypothetical protein VJV03_08355 [Pyrinomonadaceae bacterium]|nr:hypothetical protein [Pyrinomonadaceae bacterium]
MDKEHEQSKSAPEPGDCHPVSEAEIDAALEGSFPASDPIPWTLGKAPCADPEEEQGSSDK